MDSRRLVICFSLLFGWHEISQGFDFKDLDADKVISGSKGIIKAASGFSDEDEISLGKDVAANMTAKYGVLNDEKLTGYIQMIGESLVKKCSRPNLPYQFSILNSDEINAFAAPGGFIFISKGMISFLKDEAELAGVLAHEISHITEKHVVKSIRKANLFSASADFASATGENPKLKAEIAKFTTNLLLKGLSRQDELEADTMGTVLMTKVGYTPAGAMDTLHRLQQMEGSSSFVSHLTRTHPPAKDRLASVQKIIASKKLKSDGQRQQIRFKSMKPQA